MKLPEPTTDEQKERHSAYLVAKQKAKWARLDYLALFPKPPKTKTPYDMKIEHDMELIDANPPHGNETQAQYYNRVRPALTKAWFGRVVRDMGYERVSKRTPQGVIKVWKML